MSPIQQFLIVGVVSDLRTEARGPAFESLGRTIFLEVARYAARIFSVAACVDFFVHSLFRLGAFFCSFGAQRSAGRTVRLPAVLKRRHRFDCLEYYCLALLVHLAMA